MYPSFRLFATAVGLLLVLWRPALASWPPDGVLIVEGPGLRDFPSITSDGAGGAFITWREYRGATGADVYLQRVTAAGSAASGWPSTGLPVCVASGDQFDRVMVPDGSGGAYVAWVDYRDQPTNSGDIYLQRILANGSIAPGWPANGLAIAALPGTQRFAVLAPDGDGGVFVAWGDERNGASNSDIYLQRVTGQGALGDGWPAGGINICSAPGYQSFPKVAPDGAGGVFVAWDDERDPFGTSWDVYATRIGPAGNAVAGWAAGGVPVIRTNGIQGACEVAPDGSGGLFVGWLDARSAPDLQSDPFPYADLYAQRLTGDGGIAPGWPSVDSGLPICIQPRVQDALQLLPDGAGGVYFGWEDQRDLSYFIYLQRVRPDATLAPGWPVDGLKPLPSLVGFQLSPHLATDGNQGVYLSTNNLSNFYEVYTQHVTGTGALAPGWPDFGQPATSIYTDEDESQITADGFGGAIVVWKDFRNQKDDLYAKRLEPLGPTATLLSLVGTEVDPDRVRLTWHVASGALAEARVERMAESTDWSTLATVRPDASGRLVYEDRDVVPGTRYAYRLAYDDDGRPATTTEAWVVVPARYELALAGLRPNPATRGDLTVAFTLPDAVPATLDLLDVTGRRIASRSVGALGAGRHTVRLDEGHAIAAGVYWVRLTHPSRTLTARGVIVR